MSNARGAWAICDVSPLGAAVRGLDESGRWLGRIFQQGQHPQRIAFAEHDALGAIPPDPIFLIGDQHGKLLMVFDI
jgi:hypothetical protein